jgi:hypothetical protein
MDHSDMFAKLHNEMYVQAATLRPDGGKNICSAFIRASDGTEPLYFDIMKKFTGPWLERLY